MKVRQMFLTSFSYITLTFPSPHSWIPKDENFPRITSIPSYPHMTRSCSESSTEVLYKAMTKALKSVLPVIPVTNSWGTRPTHPGQLRQSGI